VITGAPLFGSFSLDSRIASAQARFMRFHLQLMKRIDQVLASHLARLISFRNFINILNYNDNSNILERLRKLACRLRRRS
jgi:hypothetical protein